MTQRERVRLALSNLLQAKLALKFAEREHAANPRPETSDKYEKAKAVAVRLQAEAERLVGRVGTAKSRARLRALLNIRWLWMMALDAFPIS